MMAREIKAARVRKGLTQNYMAEQLGISVHTYQKKESGKVPFTEKQKTNFHSAPPLNSHQTDFQHTR